MYNCYPEAVLADQIFLTRKNRKWLKDRGIKVIGKPLGRPAKGHKTAYQRRKFKREYATRNHIEGKFGQGKNGYRLNQIRAKRSDTTKSWISAILFVMNLTRLVKLAKDFLLNFIRFFYLTVRQISTDIIKSKKLQFNFMVNMA